MHLPNFMVNMAALRWVDPVYFHDKWPASDKANRDLAILWTLTAEPSQWRHTSAAYLGHTDLLWSSHSPHRDYTVFENL